MNISLEAIEALIKAGENELSGLESCARDMADQARRNQRDEDPLGARWRADAAALRSALDEARAYRDHLRRISR